MSDINQFDLKDIIGDEPEISDKGAKDQPALPVIGENVNRIKVIGVGGGGNNAINHMYKQNIPGVSFVVCNTDAQALNNSPVPYKLLIGPKITQGLGAGNNPERAKLAAEESQEQIAELFDDETQMVFITAGMGGGTGTGAAPVVAKIAKDKGVLTVGIVTIPFLFEGEKKIIKALAGANEMSKYVDALLIVNNERLTDIYKDFPFTEAFAKADDTLTTAAGSISELITCDGFINLDFNDVDTTLRNGGVAIISSGYGEGENRVTKAIEDALNSPLLKNRDVESSKHILFNIYFSRKAEDKFVMDETNELTNFMAKFAPEVDVIWGVAFDDSLGEKVKITILASGFEVSLVEENAGRSGMKKGNTEKKTITHVTEPVAEPATIITDTYGKDTVAIKNMEKARARYLVLTQEQFDNDEIIALFDKYPTLNRESRVREEIRRLSEAKKEEPEVPHKEADDGSNVINFG